MEKYKRQQRSVSNHEEELGLIKQKQGSICVHESTTRVNVVAELKGDSLQVSNVNLQKKYLVHIEEIKWRPKTRAKNKLRLNMKRILNPKLKEEKITVIEDSSSEEDVEGEEELSPQQFYIG